MRKCKLRRASDILGCRGLVFFRKDEEYYSSEMNDLALSDTVFEISATNGHGYITDIDFDGSSYKVQDSWVEEVVEMPELGSHWVSIGNSNIKCIVIGVTKDEIHTYSGSTNIDNFLLYHKRIE